LLLDPSVSFFVVVLQTRLHDPQVEIVWIEKFRRSPQVMNFS